MIPTARSALTPRRLKYRASWFARVFNFGKLLHKHSVELVVQGSYADMVAYMSALEGMRGQIFWENAAMAVDTWPNATLTLTVYTINLDKKWLTL